jgi:ribose transport system permease protein
MASINALEFRFWDNFPLRRVLRDLLTKRWMEPIVPFCMMVGVLMGMGFLIPGYLTLSNLSDVFQLFAEIALVAIGLTLVIMIGGIDLSVGSNFAVSSFVALYCFSSLGLPVWSVLLLSILSGAIIGTINGLFIGYLKVRAFMMTLVSWIVFRAIYELLYNMYGLKLAVLTRSSKTWDYFGDGAILGIPINIVCVLLVALIGHILVSRSRWGCHVKAIGGSRQAARQAGIPIKRVILSTYILCGALTGAAAMFFVARSNYVDEHTGVGLEFKVITAVILGGIALGGGKGSVPRALFGFVIVWITLNGLVQLYVPGDMNNILLGIVLIGTVGIETKWLKNKHKAIHSFLVNPAYFGFPKCSDVTSDSTSPFAVNDRLATPEAIGLDQVDGPEDIILDRKGRLYCGSRTGVIHRFSGPNFSKHEEFARTGGYPLGMAFDPDDNLIVCIAGMGLYGVRPEGEIYKLCDRTKRTWWKLKDDSWVIMADDLDIGPDGKIYFSEFTMRFDDWAIDSLEGRKNGRVLCHDPTTGSTRTIMPTLLGPNGICVAKDGQSFLLAQSWACSISRYWLGGPKHGTLEPVIENLPGYPDNINRASDGNYWVALAGMRTPTLDLAMRMPDFRRRMTKRVPHDEWLMPNFNNGCIFKINGDGEVLDVLWDQGAQSHPGITSMREDRGYVYIGGVFNNRIGRIPIEGADPEWIGPVSYWGKK